MWSETVSSNTIPSYYVTYNHDTSVQHLRQGRSFATRSVTATQRGKAIFVCTFSFTTMSDTVNAEHFVSWWKGMCVCGVEV
jgi:acyl-CoA thioesterase